MSSFLELTGSPLLVVSELVEVGGPVIIFSYPPPKINGPLLFLNIEGDRHFFPPS